MSTTYVSIDTNFPVPLNHHIAYSKKLDFASLGNLLIPAPIFDIESGISQLSDTNAALAWIELQITLFKTKQTQIKTSRNRCLPVSKLSADVLFMVFRYHKTSQPEPQYREGMKQWLGFSQVCHTWRQIALTDAQLWSRPPMQYHELCEEFIRRAGGYPLDIFNPSYTTWGLADLIFRKDKRLRKFTTYRVTRENIDKHFPNVSFESLEQFDISMSTTKQGDPNTFPLIMAPRLQRLYTFNCIYPLRIQPLKHLTYLEIISAGAIGDRLTRIPVHTLLKVITEAPNLTHVRLCGAFDEAPSSVPTDLRIPMKRLISLDLADSLVSMLQFLTGIELPTLTLANNPDHPLTKRLQQMVLEQQGDEDDTTLRISLVNGSGYDKWKLTEDDLWIELQILHKVDPSLHGSYLSQFWNRIPLDHITYLESISLEDWSVLSSLPSLTKIKIEGSIKGLIRALHEPLVSRSALRAMFPQLSVIRIMCYACELDRTEGGCDLLELARMLSNQQSLGMPLRRITMEGLEDDDEGKEDMYEVLEEYGISTMEEY